MVPLSSQVSSLRRILDWFKAAVRLIADALLLVRREWAGIRYPI